MNILIIGGLNDKQLLSKTKALVENQKIKKVYLFRRKRTIYQYEDKVKYLVHFRISTNMNTIIGKFLFDILHLFAFATLSAAGRIKLIIGIYLYPYGLYASILGKAFNIPVILVLPGTDLKMLIESRKHLKLLKNAEYIGVRGNDSIRKLAKLGFAQRKLFVLPNILNIEQFQNSINTNKKEFDIVFTGYLKKSKRIDLIIRVVKLLKTDYPEIKCMIAGDGPERTELIKLARNLDLSENITFLPHTDPIEPILTASKIFLFTSMHEGLPMSLVEAMGCGLPVISSNVNDIPDIVEHGINGYLVEDFDTNTFADYCRLLLENDDLRISLGTAAQSKIFQLCKTDYSYDSISQLWDTLINKSLRNDNQKPNHEF